MKIDPVILKLEADLAEYRRDLSSAQRLTDTKLDAIEKRGAAMGASLKSGFSLAKGAALSFAATVGAEMFIGAIKSGLDYASSLGEVAQQLGVTTDALQEYRYAATQVGLSQEEMDQALGQLTRRIGEAASGTKAQVEAFEKLGISVKDAKGNIVATGEAIPQIADALQKIESPADRAAILMDLFGRAGQKLEPLLGGGADAVRHLRDAAHDLGVVLSEDQIQRADETADKLGSLKRVLQANIAGAVSDNANSILQLANALAQVVVWAGKAASAWQAWRYQVAARQEQNRADGWFTSAADKQVAQSNANRLNAQAARINGTQDQSGSFRDYNAKPLFPNGGAGGPGRGNAAAGGASGAPAPKVSGGGGGGGGGSVRSGPSADDIARDAARNAAQFADELGRMQVDMLRAEAEYTGGLTAKRDAQNAAIDQELKSYSERIRLDSDLTKTQRSTLIAAKQSLAEREKDIVLQEYNRDVLQKHWEIEQASMQLQADALEVQGALATTIRARRDAELAIFDLAERLKDAELDKILAVEATSSAAWEIANAEKAALAATRAGRKDVVSRANEGPGAQYLRSLRKDADQLNEAYENVAVNGLQSLNDGLVDAIMGSKSLGDVFKNVANQIIADLLRIAIQKAITEPLANALFGGSGGGGGGGIFGGLLGGLFGRASGGPVAPGQFYRVNEGASPGHVEAFMSRDGGSIIPLGQMNGLAKGGQTAAPAVVQVHVMEGQMFEPRVQAISGDVSVQVVRAAAPQIVNASAQETMARAGRPKL